jgi:hypothetical protein
VPRYRLVDGDAGFVDRDLGQSLVGPCGLQGDEAAVAVAEDQRCSGLPLQGRKVLTFAGDAVVVPLGSAAAAAAPLDRVHGEVGAERAGQGRGVVIGEGQGAGDHDQSRTRPDRAVVDRKAVGGGHRHVGCPFLLRSAVRSRSVISA